jgi:hypothetical protein
MVNNVHGNTCARRVVRDITARGGNSYDAALAAHRHCGVSLLRAHRLAHGYTLVEAVEALKGLLQDRGTPGDGLAHQRLSRWENSMDTPSPRYLDALCCLYRTRPDRLGYGHDYSDAEPNPRQRFEEAVDRRHFLSAAAASAVFLPAPMPPIENIASGRGRAAITYVNLLEELTEESGLALYTTTPTEFIPARIVDLARIEACLLSTRSVDQERRLHRLFAKNATLIAIRLNDIAPLEDTFGWFGVARRSARRASDTSVEAWIAARICDACANYNRSYSSGLNAAHMAQTAGGNKANAAAVLAYLAEASVQSRLGRRRETLEAVRRADKIFASLPDSRTPDGLHVTEYGLRWYQSNALTAIGARDLAEPLRVRALELPFSQQDQVGKALLHLDKAELDIRAGELDEGCRTIVDMWQHLPAEFRIGMVPRRALEILDGVKPAYTVSREFVSARELLAST